MKFPRRPPPYQALLGQVFQELSAHPEKMVELFGHSATADDGHYLHWDELWYRHAPSERDFLWAAIKSSRQRQSSSIQALNATYSLTGPSHAHNFVYTNLSSIQKRLHEFDRLNVGHILLTALGNPDAITEYRVRQLIEEAISSSEIEGARPTTRDLARELVREGRKPTSRDEQMILNNWRAMERVLELHRARENLSLAHLLELHRILGENALEIDGAEGLLRGIGDAVEISDAEGNVWYTPPSANGIEARILALLKFANGESGDEESFLHPVLRAILCHFWLAFEHPFRDGNGRMARALFYWCMLRQGYEMAEFLSISGPIDRSPKKYYLAFAHAETDEGDLTYFILNQLDTISAAIDELLGHLKERALSMKRLEAAVSDFRELNHRQRSLLQHAIRHSGASYTIAGHARSHEVHYITAQKDLADLVERGFLDSTQDGQKKRFFVTPDSKRRLTGSTKRRR